MAVKKKAAAPKPATLAEVCAALTEYVQAGGPLPADKDAARQKLLAVLAK